MGLDRAQKVSTTMEVKNRPSLGVRSILDLGFCPFGFERLLGSRVVLPIPAEHSRINPLLGQQLVHINRCFVPIVVGNNRLGSIGARVDRTEFVVESGHGLELLQRSFVQVAAEGLGNGHNEAELVGP
jgi:hypothetical protein